MLSGTKFSLPKEKMRLFESFVLDGQRYFTRGGVADYLGVGREIARGGALSGAIKSATGYMLQTPEYERLDELKEYYGSLDGGAPGFAGTKYFEHSLFSFTQPSKISYRSARRACRLCFHRVGKRRKTGLGIISRAEVMHAIWLTGGNTMTLRPFGTGRFYPDRFLPPDIWMMTGCAHIGRMGRPSRQKPRLHRICRRWARSAGNVAWKATSFSGLYFIYSVR